jgi:hypothetical protein
LSSRPGALDRQKEKLQGSSAKSAFGDRAGRYTKRSGDAAARLSETDRALLATMRDRAPRLTQLIADSEDTDNAPEALRELERLLREGRKSKPPR